jgi:outer membrane immunogenic protein
MTKTFTPLASAIALAAALAASSAHADATSFEGFYGGLSISSVGISPNWTAADIQNSVGYELFGGYNHALNSNWVVGGELSFGASGTHDVSGSATTVDLENMVTISARAGYVFDNTMIYGRLGYQIGEFSISTNPVTPDLEGVIFGLGVEHMFTDTVSGRIELSRSALALSGMGVPPGAEIDRTALSIGIAFHF